jgi:hypothetical protein
MGIYASQYTPVITRVHIVTVKAVSLLAEQNERGCTGAQNYAAHHGLCCRAFEPQSCAEANTVVLWHFLTMMQIHLFAIQAVSENILERSPIY